ncbi:phosphate acyltransferase PlsX, partial [Micromonospora aurantiaca]
MAVDLLGGDDAPAVVVDGALRAVRTDPALHLMLVGPIEVADELIGALDPAQRARVTVRPVRTAVGMADHPT